MARLPYLDQDSVAAENRDLLQRDLNLYRAVIHSPKGLRAFRRLGRFIREEGRLDPRLRELAILQVGYVTRSRYEWVHHIEIGRTFGVSDADIRAIGLETAGRSTDLDALAKKVLKAAREITVDLTISDETFAGLGQYLDHECMVELVLAISFYNAVVRMLASLEIDVEKDCLHYLKEFPLPSD
jgi:alkylhydroperoxidase family enzyme